MTSLSRDELLERAIRLIEAEEPEAAILTLRTALAQQASDPYASDVADWCQRELDKARETGTIVTRPFVQNVELIIKALRAFATPQPADAVRGALAKISVPVPKDIVASESVERFDAYTAGVKAATDAILAALSAPGPAPELIRPCVTDEMVEAACKARHTASVWGRTLNKPTMASWITSNREMMRSVLTAAMDAIGVKR